MKSSDLVSLLIAILIFGTTQTSVYLTEVHSRSGKIDEQTNYFTALNSELHGHFTNAKSVVDQYEESHTIKAYPYYSSVVYSAGLVNGNLSVVPDKAEIKVNEYYQGIGLFQENIRMAQLGSDKELADTLIYGQALSVEKEAAGLLRSLNVDEIRREIKGSHDVLDSARITNYMALVASAGLLAWLIITLPWKRKWPSKLFHRLKRKNPTSRK
jgi:hypothetical protein